MKPGATEPLPPSGRIRFEHIALNVSKPIEMAKWYAENLGMRIIQEGPAPINARFIADRGGHLLFELYTNPPDSVPDYASMNPLLLHLAFMVENVDAVCTHLIGAGATLVGETTVTPSGDRIATLRDPWGLSLQFVTRAVPMLSYS
jgi:glyoxylase I family protein